MKTVLIKPVISEKTIRVANSNNQYTFKVDINSNKIEIAKAVEAKFGVKVEGVTTSVVLGKEVRWGKKRTPGKRSNFKKAVVKLKDGDKIALFDIK